MNIEDQLADLIGDLPDGMTEGVALGTGLADGYDLYESTIGDVAVTFNPDGVSSVDIADDTFKMRFEERFGRKLIRAEAPSAWRQHIPTAIEAGRPGKLVMDLRSVTPFQAAVLARTATIPKGEVRPYSWLAREVERPGAVRAAGSAVARNPVPLIIPCHRVVRADGHIGNYSLGGPQNKHDLLEHEGAHPDWLEDLASSHIRLQGNTSTRTCCHPTCHVIRQSNKRDLVNLHTLQEAKSEGFKACEVCRPG
jgi:O-6-methylguanine DNA methyltransferase